MGGLLWQVRVHERKRSGFLHLLSGERGTENGEERGSWNGQSLELLSPPLPHLAVVTGLFPHLLWIRTRRSAPASVPVLQDPRDQGTHGIEVIFLCFTKRNLFLLLKKLASVWLLHWSFSKEEIGWGCSYTVKIKTSCSSRRFTTDRISLAFGDAYHNEVSIYYAFLSSYLTYYFWRNT